MVCFSRTGGHASECRADWITASPSLFLSDDYMGQLFLEIALSAEESPLGQDSRAHKPDSLAGLRSVFPLLLTQCHFSNWLLLKNHV